MAAQRHVIAIATRVCRRSFVVAAVLLPLLVALGATPADASTGPTVSVVVGSWGTNGRVTAILPLGDRVIVGGTFTSVTDPSGNTYPAAGIAAYLPASGAFDTSWTPDPNGAVNSIAAAGSEVYFGGDFTQVGGQPRTRLAAVDAATGQLSAWAPSANKTVNTVAVGGGNVYVGGAFTTLAGPNGSFNSAFLGRVDASTGAVDSVWTPRPSDQVRALALSSDGTQVYAGGDFQSISGVTSAVHIASIDTATGSVTRGFVSGATNGTTRPPALGLYVDGSHLLAAVAGAGGACASLDPTTGATQWSDRSNGNVQAVTAINGVAYCGGHFDGTGSFAGQPRNKLAAVDDQTGQVLAYAPRINSALGLWSIASDGTQLFVGGDFTKIDAKTQGHFAQIISASAQTAPGPVMNLVATPGDASVKLFWDRPWTDGGPAISTFKVYRASGNSDFVYLAKTKALSWTDTGLVDGVEYTYAVSAVNSVGEGPMSDPQSVTPSSSASSPPTKPQSVAATSSDATANVTWTAPADTGGSPITAYNVLRGTSQGGEQLIATVDATVNSYNDNQVTLGTTYYYEIVAVNAAGDSPPSSEASVVITAAKPSAPVLSATATTGAVNLSWTAPDSGTYPVTKYTVLRDGIQYATVKVPTTTYVDTAVTSGVSYTYRVRATSLAGNSPLSAPVTVTVP